MIEPDSEDRLTECVCDVIGMELKQANEKMVGRMQNKMIGEELREVRENEQWSLRGTAEHMGISAAYLSDLETGKRTWTRSLASRFKTAVSRRTP